MSRFSFGGVPLNATPESLAADLRGFGVMVQEVLIDREESKATVVYVTPVNRSFSTKGAAPEAEFSELFPEHEILMTGIKVVDLLAPYAK